MTSKGPGIVKAAVVATINELEMGVLDDGTPFLTARGLARICGVAASTVIQQGRNWTEGKRDGKLAKMLLDRGIARSTLYVALDDGSHAYTDDACMVFLEYYGFESTPKSEQAQENFRRLAHAGMRLFIYAALGYSKQFVIPPAWKSFHERLMLNATPRGFFTVFMELSQFVLTLIQRGLTVDTQTVPDISVGLIWSKYWSDNAMQASHGKRLKYIHKYPDDYNQMKEVEAWAYPISALGDFRTWLDEVYIPEKFTNYIKQKVKALSLPASTAELLLAAFEEDAPKKLPGSS